MWAMTRTTSRRRCLRWLVDNVVLPSGSKVAIPLYHVEEGERNGRRKAFGGVFSGLGTMAVAVVSMIVGVGVGLVVAGAGGGGGRGGRRGGEDKLRDEEIVYRPMNEFMPVCERLKRSVQ